MVTIPATQMHSKINMINAVYYLNNGFNLTS